jgi:nicotinamide riboside transporter PnuC
MLLILLDLFDMRFYGYFIWRVQKKISTTQMKEYTMKNIVRAFVVALVVTGAVASIHATTTPSVKTIAAPVQPDLLPLPACDPNDPGNCGMTK